MVDVNLASLGIVVGKLFGRFMLIALGLVVIFGMMGVINLAHGEFMMIGAYTTVILEQQGIPFFLAIAVGGIMAGILGGVIERLIIRQLYGRVIETLLVTWGVSIILTQSMLMIFGSTYPGVSIPFGSLQVGGANIPVYEVIISVAAFILVAALFVLFRYTSYGLKARATLQNPEMADSLGVNTSLVYFGTFVLGSVLAGVAGGLLAPLFSITPYIGQSFIIEAFMIVIVGGAEIFVGLISGSLLLSTVSGSLSVLSGGLASKVGLLLASIVVLRLFPEGLSGYWRQWNE